MESNFGYQIGQRVKCICNGWTNSHHKFRSDRVMQRGDEGIITNVDGDYTEILLSNGDYITRSESHAVRYIEIISTTSEPNYEIY